MLFTTFAIALFNFSTTAGSVPFGAKTTYNVSTDKSLTVSLAVGISGNILGLSDNKLPKVFNCPLSIYSLAVL